VLFAAWGWCVAYVACVLFGPAQAPSELLSMTLDQPDLFAGACCLLLLALGLWILLVSTWIPQGGAAVLGAVLLLGLLALPIALVFKESPWLVNELRPRRLGGLLMPLAVLSGVPLLVLGLSYLRGNRFLASAWAPAWRGLSLLAVLTGGGYALGASALERIQLIDPHDPEFRIASGCVGVGGRYAYVNVHRGWRAWQSGSPVNSGAGTPYQPWIVDLGTGAHRRGGEFEEGWLALPENPLALQPIVRRIDAAGEGVTWLDAATATERKVLPNDVRTPEILAWEREALASLCWNHDAEGRGLWFEGDSLVREGDPLPKELRHRAGDGGYQYPVPGGWRRATWKQGGSIAQHVIIEAATGKARAPIPSRRAGSAMVSAVLNPTQLLTFRVAPQAPGVKGPRAVTYTIVNLDAPESETVVQAPVGMREVYLSQHVVLQDGRVLGMAGEDPDAKELILWAPLTGAVTPVIDQWGKPFVGYAVGVNAKVPEDVLVVTVTRHSDTGTGVSMDRLLLHGETSRARRLTSQGYYFDVLAIVDAHTVITVEDGNKIVRHGPDPRTSTVLFPRR
jgi:hypothetical protein